MALLAQVVLYIILPRKELWYFIAPIVQSYSILLSKEAAEMMSVTWTGRVFAGTWKMINSNSMQHATFEKVRIIKSVSITNEPYVELSITQEVY